MRQVWRRLAALAMACFPMAACAVASESPKCQAGAVAKLRALSPSGFAIYRKVGDTGFFNRWIDCRDGQFDLPTAVHESVHHITSDTDAFPLIDGGELKRPHEVSAFFAPALTAASFKRNDFVENYLVRGGASSADDFLYLLDELNAYSHDLHTAVQLSGMRRGDEQVDHRDGLAALMSYVAAYLQRAEERDPQAWRGLQKKPAASVISTLWNQAEQVMVSSCEIPRFGTEDQTSLRRLCQPGARSALTAILGRAPVCPTACLQPRQETEEAALPYPETTGSLRPKPTR